MAAIGNAKFMSSWRLYFLLVALKLVTYLSLSVDAVPHRILVDTDMDTDDIFALLYLLKLNRSEFDVAAITINANTWSNAGHAVNHLYDILYMMDRDDIPVGVGGEGGILPDGTILQNVGGYLPLIEQGMSTAGGCRYRQAIPLGQGGRLDVDSNYGIRRSFLPQGKRKYIPLRQSTTQEVMLSTISSGPTTVFVLGAHTNLALFIMSNPRLKRNITHIYVMGGGIKSRNPTGCCPPDANPSCRPRQCGDHGNMFTAYTSNPYAEFNIFGDPFAAYQVLHSGIPVTLVPLDATNTIPISEGFFEAFESMQSTYEARYCFQSLKMARDTWFDGQFYASYFMWDSFTSGIATSIMRNKQHNGWNEFAEMEYRNITVVTSNKPYGVSDSSNPFFGGQRSPKFNLHKNGVHSGHVQEGIQDYFCLSNGRKGKCKDGYTMEVATPEGVRVLVAKKAKPNRDGSSALDKEFFKSFLDVMNYPHHSGRLALSNALSYGSSSVYMSDFTNRPKGMPVVFDMDMSVGDFISLIYLLKVPIEKMDLKAILVSANGWGSPATIDVVYDVLHLMGRDDIPVGLGSFFALGQASSASSTVGSCKYIKSIPQGAGGLLDSDTLFGLSRSLPRGPRRYTAENSMKYGAPRDTDHPELRQPSALQVWEKVTRSMSVGQKITLLTNGPLTNLASIILEKNGSSLIQMVYIVGGVINDEHKSGGNIFTLPLNKYAEFHMFLDPLAASSVIDSGLDITLVPLTAQQQVSSFSSMLMMLRQAHKTPENIFVRRLLARLHLLQQHDLYHHVDMFLGETLGAVLLVDDAFRQSSIVKKFSIKVVASGNVSEDGQLLIDKKGSWVRAVEWVNDKVFYNAFSNLLSDSS